MRLLFYKSADDDDLSFGVTEETRGDYKEEITVSIPSKSNKDKNSPIVRAMLKTSKERKGQDLREIEIKPKHALK